MGHRARRRIKYLRLNGAEYGRLPYRAVFYGAFGGKISRIDRLLPCLVVGRSQAFLLRQPWAFGDERLRAFYLFYGGLKIVRFFHKIRFFCYS